MSINQSLASDCYAVGGRIFCQKTSYIHTMIQPHFSGAIVVIVSYALDGDCVGVLGVAVDVEVVVVVLAEVDGVFHAPFCATIVCVLSFQSDIGW